MLRRPGWGRRGLERTLDASHAFRGSLTTQRRARAQRSPESGLRAGQERSAADGGTRAPNPARATHPRYGRGRSEPDPQELTIFEVTTDAVRLIEEARNAQEVPDSFGIRVFSHADDNGQGSLALAFAEQPAEGDEVTEQAGTEIYLAPELVAPLADTRLDVQHSVEGTQLALVRQAAE